MSIMLFFSVTFGLLVYLQGLTNIHEQVTYHGDYVKQWVSTWSIYVNLIDCIDRTHETDVTRQHSHTLNYTSSILLPLDITQLHLVNSTTCSNKICDRTAKHMYRYSCWTITLCLGITFLITIGQFYFNGGFRFKLLVCRFV